jgi:hypothetical protein
MSKITITFTTELIPDSNRYYTRKDGSDFVDKLRAKLASGEKGKELILRKDREQVCPYKILLLYLLKLCAYYVMHRT